MFISFNPTLLVPSLAFGFISNIICAISVFDFAESVSNKTLFVLSCIVMSQLLLLVPYTFDITLLSKSSVIV